jgi:hypothetical protein
VSVLGKRMRCADCEHRWTIEAPQLDAAPEVLVPAPEPEVAPEQVPEQVPEPAPEPQPQPESDADDAEDVRSLGWLWWVAGLVVLLVAGVIGLVVLERIDAARVPLVGSALARLQPGPSPLSIDARARLTPLPGGARLLEVTGTLRNVSQRSVDVGPLKATLGGAAVGGGGSVARRWTIALPVARLAPGESVAFSSTLTDVPGGAARLRITTG